MPVIKCRDGTYRIGGGPCVYESKAKAEKAWRAVKAKKRKGKR